MNFDKIRALNEELLQNIKKNLPELEKLLEEVNGHWAAEDLLYRYYHGSFKVYYIQEYTQKIVSMLKNLAPKGINTFNSSFEKIYKKGTGKIFKHEHNADWDKHTLPMLQAFFHAREFLTYVVKYGKELEHAPECLPSGWGLVLYFFNLR
jgi:hypothetical protein